MNTVTHVELTDGQSAELSPDYLFTINSPKFGAIEVWAPSRFRRDISERTWCVSKDPKRIPGREFRVLTNQNYRPLYLHVFIWQLAGHERVKMIDHVDGNSLNNRESNLRDGTVGNVWNTPCRRDNKAGLKGICWAPPRPGIPKGRWIAKVMAHKKVVHCSEHARLEDAIAARDAAALKFHGEFAVLNAPR